MKQTSIKAYKEIREDGTLTKRQQEVMALFNFYRPIPLTAKMVSTSVPNGWKRLSELEDMGLIKVSGECTDMDTHKTVSVYSLGKTEANKPKKVSREDLVDHIKHLQDRINKTTEMLSDCYDFGYNQCRVDMGIDEKLTEAYKKGVADVIAGNVPGVGMWEEE